MDVCGKHSERHDNQYKSRWEIYDDRCARLYDKYNVRLASLTKSSGDLWVLDTTIYFASGSYWLEANNIKDAIYKATITINERCNKVIRHTSTVRDSLPRLQELYEAAYEGETI